VAHPSDRFDEIVLGDTESFHRTGELYEAVCLAYKELRSGRQGALWCDELGAAPPHAHGKNILYVGFTAAEPEFYQSVWGDFDSAFLDLRVEGIHQTNVAYHREDPRRQKLPRSLISFLRVNDIDDGDEALKRAMHDRILRGPPFTPQERELILKYCRGDVELLEKLLWVLLPRIPNFAQALWRGEYVKLTAEMFHLGMPADPWSADLLRQPEVRQAVRLRAVSDTDLTHGLYTGPTLTQAMVKEFVVRHKIKGWRPTDTGKLGASFKDFERLEARHPEEFNGLADTHKTIQQMHEFSIFSGSDGRYRDPLWAFSTITSRIAPSSSPFTAPAWYPDQRSSDLPLCESDDAAPRSQEHRAGARRRDDRGRRRRDRARHSHRRGLPGTSHAAIPVWPDAQGRCHAHQIRRTLYR
jgi:DNA polymerase I